MQLFVFQRVVSWYITAPAIQPMIFMTFLVSHLIEVADIMLFLYFSSCTRVEQKMTRRRHGQTNAKDEGTDWSVILEVLKASADSFLGAVCRRQLPFPPANSVFHTKMLHGKRRKGRTYVKLGNNLKHLVTK